MERRATSLLSLILAIAPLFSSNAFAEPPIYVGVIENINDAWHPEDRKQRVRVAFVKEKGEWHPAGAYPESPAQYSEPAYSFPDQVNWTVVFDGRNLGQISSKNHSFGEGSGGLGLQMITSPESAIPKVAIAASDFTYIAGFNRARTRPLLVVSGPNYRDPENWKRTMLSDAEHKVAIDEFRKKVPTLRHCDEPEADKQQLLPYTDGEVILIKAYRASSGELLFGERLDDARSGCEFFDDDNFFDYWFARTKDGTIHFLGTQMMPLDAADLDNDGVSEWVFHTSRGEDEEGYELFYGDFSKKAYFYWFYH